MTIIGAILMASTVSAQQAPAPDTSSRSSSAASVRTGTPSTAADATLYGMTATRGARYLLRNGLDYLNYKEYDRSLKFLREAETHQKELNDAERLALKQGIERAQRGLREPSETEDAYAVSDRSRPRRGFSPARPENGVAATDGKPLHDSGHVRRATQSTMHSEADDQGEPIRLTSSDSPPRELPPSYTASIRSKPSVPNRAPASSIPRGNVATSTAKSAAPTLPVFSPLTQPLESEALLGASPTANTQAEPCPDKLGGLAAPPLVSTAGQGEGHQRQSIVTSPSVPPQAASLRTASSDPAASQYSQSSASVDQEPAPLPDLSPAVASPTGAKPTESKDQIRLSADVRPELRDPEGSVSATAPLTGATAQPQVNDESSMPTPSMAGLAQPIVATSVSNAAPNIPIASPPKTVGAQNTESGPSPTATVSAPTENPTNALPILTDKAPNQSAHDKEALGSGTLQPQFVSAGAPAMTSVQNASPAPSGEPEKHLSPLPSPDRQPVSESPLSAQPAGLAPTSASGGLVATGTDPTDDLPPLPANLAQSQSNESGADAALSQASGQTTISPATSIAEVADLPPLPAEPKHDSPANPVGSDVSSSVNLTAGDPGPAATSSLAGVPPAAALAPLPGPELAEPPGMQPSASASVRDADGRSASTGASVTQPYPTTNLNLVPTAPNPARNSGTAVVAVALAGSNPSQDAQTPSADDSPIPHRSPVASSLRPDQLREVERIARMQEDQSRRPIQNPSQPPPPPADTTASDLRTQTQLDISRAPSPAEARPIKAIPVPDDWVPLAPRDWSPQRKYWAAAATCHLPLYFQDPVLERYGHSVEQFVGPVGRYLSYPVDDTTQSTQRNQLVQPFFSAGLFALQIIAWPYNLIMDPPWESQYDLGYYRPGDNIPTDLYWLPLHGYGPPLHGKSY
jgi:hypothetical protein